MTAPIDATPEAIAALLDGVTPGPWRVEHETTLIWGHCDRDDATDRGMGYPVSECRITPVSSWARGPDAAAGEANARFIAAARDLVPALANEIARLTEKNIRLSMALAESEALEEQHGVVIKRVMAERDEARAQVAMAHEVAARLCNDTAQEALDESGTCSRTLWTWFHGQSSAIRALTPAEATAALSRRDAAMRNEGRKSVKVKPLAWGPYPNPVFAGPDIAVAHVSGSVISYYYQAGRNPYAPGYYVFAAPTHMSMQWRSDGYNSIQEAKAAAQADYEARILAALEPEGGE